MREVGLLATRAQDPTASCRASRRRWQPCCPSTGCTLLADSRLCSCTYQDMTLFPRWTRILDSYVASEAQVLVLSAVRAPPAMTPGRSSMRRRGNDCCPTSIGWPKWPRKEVSAQCYIRTSARMIETRDEVQRVLDGSWISLCLDTGHLLIGGTDPAELARQAPERIAHLHLKDVDSTVAAKGQSVGSPTARL